MTDKYMDRLRGRAKEAAGVLSGNKRLKDEGRIDQAKASTKDAAEKVVDALSGSAKQ
jgi:uncharacterized protein YjbJ (UPF0337 family)